MRTQTTRKKSELRSRNSPPHVGRRLSSTAARWWPLLGVLVLTRTAAPADLPWTVALSSTEIFQGGVVRVDVAGQEISRVAGSLRDRELSFYPGSQAAYTVLLGVDLEEKAGGIPVVIRVENHAGVRSEAVVTLRVKERPFPKEELSVSPKFDRVDEATKKRIEKERDQLVRLWGLAGGPRLWEGAFFAPVPGEVTSPFGLRRIVNGSPRSPHTGVDLKASLGAEVLAPNHGKVVLREEFFFSGKSIVLDHGAGLYTMYFHLADFRVAEQQPVRRGEPIGRAGMSGRVTGPHLHWAARLHGARIDPFELMHMTGRRP